jgi:hypothetical protein
MLNYWITFLTCPLRLAHEAHHGAVDCARDAQAAHVGVAGGDAQRNPLGVGGALLRALGRALGRAPGRGVERRGAGPHCVALLFARALELAPRLAALRRVVRAARAAAAHVDGLGGAQADGLAGAGGAEERDHRAQRVGGARERLDVLGVHAHVRAVVEVAARGEALRLRGAQAVVVEERGDARAVVRGHAGGGGNTIPVLFEIYKPCTQCLSGRGGTAGLTGSCVQAMAAQMSGVCANRVHFAR